MGEVYLAEDTLLGRRVAVKRLLPIFAEDEEFVARFKREARSVSRLAHPGIVTIHSLDWISGVLLLDMEFVDGVSLLHLMQTSVITPPFTARLAYELLSALAICHESGIVHRDIKPSNILLTESLQPKLVDFGIATALADSTVTQLREGRSTTIVLGTPRFMAPEAWDGAEITPQWDLFALGVVLYECLTGEAAFKGTTTSALARQITNEPLPKIALRVPAISAQLAHLIDSLVVIDPAQRCASARQALQILDGVPELEAFTHGETVRRSPTKLIQNTWRLARGRASAGIRARRWFHRGLLLAALLALVALTGLYRDDLAALFVAQNASPEVDPGRAVAARPLQKAYTLLPLSGDDTATWHWWISRSRPSGDWVVLGYSPLALLSMTMSEREGSLHFSGDWAGYSNALARGFRTGTVSGQGRWQGDQRGLALTLAFVDVGSGTSSSESYIAEPVHDEVTQATFLRAIEEADLLPALLYYALEPRNIPFGASIAALLPANGQRVYAPLISDSAKPVIDGRLEDETWRTPVYERSGRVGELNAGRDGRAIFRRTELGLCVSVWVPSAAGRSVEAEVGVMQGISRPPRLGDRAVISFNGTNVHDRQYFIGVGEVPFPVGWEIAAASSADGAYTIEMFIPFREDATPTAPWRFNAVVTGDTENLSPRNLARWGDMDKRALEHGALITFREPAE